MLIINTYCLGRGDARDRVGGSRRGELLGTLESKGEEEGSRSSLRKYRSRSSSLRVVKSGPKRQEESRKGTSLMI